MDLVHVFADVTESDSSPEDNTQEAHYHSKAVLVTTTKSAMVNYPPHLFTRKVYRARLKLIH